MNNFFHIFLFNYKKMMKSWMVILLMAITILGVLGGVLVYKNEAVVKNIDVYVLNQASVNISASQISEILGHANNQIQYNVILGEKEPVNEQFTGENVAIELLKGANQQIQLKFSYDNPANLSQLQEIIFSESINRLILQENGSINFPQIEILDNNVNQNNTNVYASYIVSFALYMFILLCGTIITSSIALEKISRVSDLITYRISPIVLIYGKVFSLFAILLQLCGLVVIELTVIHLLHITDLSQLFHVLKDIGFTSNVLWIICIAFVLGIAIYTLLYVVIGLLIQSAEQIQFAQFPVAAIALASFIVSVFSNRAPNGTLSNVSMFIPFLYPFVLPIRLLGKISSPFELIISLSIVVIYMVAGNLLLKRLFFTKK